MACDAPISIKKHLAKPDKNGNRLTWIPVDCGKCLPCLTKRKAQWSYRLCEEMRDSFSAYFVTLTYEDKYLPLGDNCSVVNPADHVEFIKNLKLYETRKYLNARKTISAEELERKRNKTVTTLVKDGKTIRKPLKYYGVSEFGDNGGRIHWHYIIFNLVDIENINKAWGRGRIDCSPANVNTIDYVLKYMLKHQDERNEDKEIRERSFMSKGLGLCALTPEMKKYISTPEGNQVINVRGKKVALPRYYRKKFLNAKQNEDKGIYIKSILEKQENSYIEQSSAWVYDAKVAQSKNDRNRILKYRQKRKL